MKVFELRDFYTKKTCGAVIVTKIDKKNSPKEEIDESWIEFNQYEKHNLPSDNVDDFVKWSNENRVTQIKRIHIEILQPQ